MVYSIDWVRQRLDIFSFRTLTSMLPLLPISLSSELSDGSLVCSIQALVLFITICTVHTGRPLTVKLKMEFSIIPSVHLSRVIAVFAISLRWRLA